MAGLFSPRKVGLLHSVVHIVFIYCGVTLPRCMNLPFVAKAWKGGNVGMGSGLQSEGLYISTLCQ